MLELRRGSEKSHSNIIIFSFTKSRRLKLRSTPFSPEWSWDRKSGQCLEVLSKEEANEKRPEWLHARANATLPGSVSGDWFASPTARYASLRHKTLPSARAIWNADSDAKSPYLQADGTLVVTQRNGQVCFLKLHHGHRRITLAEAEAVLVERLRLRDQNPETRNQNAE